MKLFVEWYRGVRGAAGHWYCRSLVLGQLHVLGILYEENILAAGTGHFRDCPPQEHEELAP